MLNFQLSDKIPALVIVQCVNLKLLIFFFPQLMSSIEKINIDIYKKYL